MEVPPSPVGSGVIVGAVPAAGGSDRDSGVTTITAAAAAAAEAGAGNKVAAAVEEDHKVMPAAAEGKKRKRTTVRVLQGYVDLVLKKYPFTPCPSEPEVIEKRVPDPAAREKFRAVMASAAAMAKATRGKDEAIVKQDLAQGYAEEEVEFSEEEEA